MFPRTSNGQKPVDMFLEPKVRTGRIVDMFLTAFLRTGTKNDYLFHFLVPRGDRGAPVQSAGSHELKSFGSDIQVGRRHHGRRGGWRDELLRRRPRGTRRVTRYPKARTSPASGPSPRDRPLSAPTPVSSVTGNRDGEHAGKDAHLRVTRLRRGLVGG